MTETKCLHCVVVRAIKDAYRAPDGTTHKMDFPLVIEALASALADAITSWPERGERAAILQNVKRMLTDKTLERARLRHLEETTPGAFGGH